MQLTNEQRAQIIGALEHAKKRPTKYLHMGPHSVLDFFNGFYTALKSIGVEVDAWPEIRPMLTERGYPDHSPQAVAQMQKNGMTPEDIAAAFIDMHLASWRDFPS